MTPVEILRGARKLIEVPEHWKQGAFRGDGAYCADGACMEVDITTNGFRTLSDEYWKAFRALRDACGGSVWSFNDAHTHTEVLAAFDRAIALAEKAGAA